MISLLMPFDLKNPTTAKDYSGNEYNGVVHGATWVNSGKIGGAYSFDGVDDYISIPDNYPGGVGYWNGVAGPSILGSDGAWSEITIEAWIYLSGNQKNVKILSKMPSYEIGIDNQQRLFAGIWAYTSSAQYPLFSGGERTRTYSTPLSTDTWYHVAVAYKDGESFVLYVNGVSVASTATAPAQ